MIHFCPLNKTIRMNNVSRLKVIVGYTALLAMLLFSLYFVHREMKSLMRPDGQSLLWMDSLSTLLEEKDKNTIRILRTLAEANDSLLSGTAIEHILTIQDTMPVRPRVQRRVVRHRDTLVTPPAEKKGFFRRLRDAFVPPKHDSAVQVKTSVEYTADTLQEEYAPLDTLQARLRAVVEHERQADSLIRRRKRRLQAVNAQLTARIDTLLKHYEENILLQARADARQREELRRRSAFIVGSIAVGGVLLAALFLLLIGRDITRSNRYRHELEEARRRAEELLAVRERLMLAITHDFKAPLGSIMGYADLLSRLTVDERQRFYLHNMKTSSEHLLKLVTDLLDFHRLDLHKMDIRRIPFHPARLLEEIRVSFEPLTAAKGLALHCDVDSELQGTFVSDPLRLRQIVTNLLSNAVKFTDQGSITLRAAYEGSRLVLSVSDTGRGMNPADCERIFQEFTRLPDAQGKEGFGLGLSIVKMLAQLLGGVVDVSSVPGQGSTFTLRLPLDKAAQEASRNPVEEASVVQEETGGGMHLGAIPLKKVLLIDDDRIQLTLTAAMLAQNGIESVACLRVDELLDALRADVFDVLLTDVQMPAINGFELVQLLRASGIPQAQAVPVVAVTARSDMQREEFTSHGFAGCLHKPFTVQELLDELSSLSGVPVARPTVVTAPIAVSSSSVADEAAVPDFSALTAYSSDDPTAARSILQSFAEETRRNADLLRRAVDVADADSLSAVAHKMIPLFTLIGTTRLVSLLRQLEAAKGQSFSEELKQIANQALEGVESVRRAAENISKVEPVNPQKQ